MWKRISLRDRIYFLLASLVLLTLAGGLITVWYTYRMEGLLTRIIDEDVAAFRTAAALETALINQKGFVSYYFMDGNPEWLRQLAKYRRVFQEELQRARSLVRNRKQAKAVDLIEAEYIKYITSKDRVIAYYKSGQRETGEQLHQKVREYFFNTLELCQDYKDLHRERIQEVRGKSRQEAAKLRVIAAVAILTVLLLGVLLAIVLVGHILGPLRNLALEAGRRRTSPRSGNEVQAISQRVRGLIKDVHHTQSELERSREHLLQAEKMALVGKLAAGTAHSIRNPLTSLKMRLFSLTRTLRLTLQQKEDFEVISEEIRHIDTIVQNFLEFSRPPKLRMQQVQPSEVVDAAIQLLRHRLQAYDVRVKQFRPPFLPLIEADPEQLKEVIVNLVVNACEAMKKGGTLEIHEEVNSAGPCGATLSIRVLDEGPGIPPGTAEKIFQPFFTTKEEGTGLGLSIAARIIEQHGGRLELGTRDGEGAAFVISLPVKE
jgi:signal transduction histidine kinase